MTSYRQNIDNYKQIAIRMLRVDEGVRNFPYDDNTGHRVKVSGFVTIGVGRNLNANPLSDDEIDYLLCNDIKRVETSSKKIYPNFNTYNDVRKATLIAMAFWIGVGRLSQFKEFLSFVSESLWEKASVAFIATPSMINFKKSFPNSTRPERYAYQLKEGKFHEYYK